MPVRYPMRVLVVDDEPPALAGMRALLGRHADVRIVGDAAGGRAAIRAIRSLEPDLVFLDVQMPEVDGFDVLHAIGADGLRAVIFVTAHDEFAVRAFEVRAVDYLLKPVSEERFDEALDRARRSLAAEDDAELARRLRLVRETLGALESRLDPRSFVRIHRSAIVSLARIVELQRHPMGGVSVVLRDGTRLPVSRGRRANLDAVLGASR